MYITAQTLQDAFSKTVLIQLSNDDSRATAVNTDVIEKAIMVACERIDTALRGRYRLPLTDVPELIKYHALYLARHWLYARRPESKMPDTVKETYAQTLKELEQIATGRLHLGLIGVDDETHGNLLLDAGEFVVKAQTKTDLGAY